MSVCHVRRQWFMSMEQFVIHEHVHVHYEVRVERLGLFY